MDNQDKSRDQLIKELEELQHENSLLKASYNKEISRHGRTEDVSWHGTIFFKRLIENLPQRIFIKDLNSVYISPRKKMEREIQVSLEKFSKIFSLSPSAVSIIDLKDQGRILECNKVFESLAGYTHEEIIGSTSEKLGLVVHREIWDKIVEEVIAQGHTYNNECDFCSKSGSVKKGLVSAEAVNLDGILCAIVNIQDITELKKTEAQLTESQTMLKSIIDSTSDMIWSVDAQRFGLLNWNISLQEYFLNDRGIAIDVGMSPADLFPADLENISFWISIYRLTLEKGSFSEEYIAFNNTRTLLINTGLLIKGDKAYGVSIFAKDITERRKAENNLQEMLNFETLLTEISAKLVQVKPQKLGLEITNAQRRICEFLNLDVSSIYQPGSESGTQMKLTYVYHRPDEIVLPDELIASNYFPWCEKQLLAGIIPIVHSMKDLPAEAAIDRESWAFFGVKSSAMFPLIESDGQVMGTISFDALKKEHFYSDELLNRLNLVAQLFANSLKRIKTEQILSFSESKYRLIAENSTDVIWVLDPVNMRFDYVSPSAYREWGYTPDEIIEQTPIKVLTNETLKAIELVMEGSKKEETAYLKTIEVVQIHKDGSIAYTELNTTFYLNELGKPEVLGVSHNITDRKKAEIELIESKEKAEESDRLKTAFLNNISHEIRTPLNSILGFANLVTQPDITQEEKVDYLSILNSSSERLIQTITDYMDISLIVSGNMSIDPTPVDIATFMDFVYHRVQKTCVSKNLDLKIHHSANAENYIIITDKHLLEKSLFLLLNNAIKFTTEGSITLSYELHDENLEINLSDTGIGISQNALNRIFDVFMQENVSTTRSHEGSGLGLSIANGIIRLLGGHIQIESEQFKGTTVRITLPI